MKLAKFVFLLTVKVFSLLAANALNLYINPHKNVWTVYTEPLFGEREKWKSEMALHLLFIIICLKYFWNNFPLAPFPFRLNVKGKLEIKILVVFVMADAVCARTNAHLCWQEQTLMFHGSVTALKCYFVLKNTQLTDWQKKVNSN